MDKYVYQIQGAMETANGEFIGFRVLVCDLNNFESVDVPATVIDRETRKYLEFRLQLTDQALNIQRLPAKIQDNIRAPLGRWLDYWVVKNFYGNTSNTKGINPWLLEDGVWYTCWRYSF